MDEDGYPTQELLEIIRKWDISNKPIKELIELLEDSWYFKNWGFKLRGKRVLYLQLHTGGWSGNEDIISALRENLLFWHLYWQKSIRGGHYYFRIPTGRFIKSKSGT